MNETPSPTDLWEALGQMPEEEHLHVLTKLFAIYEKKLENNPEDREAHRFFTNLGQAVSQTDSCNLNRR